MSPAPQQTNSVVFDTSIQVVPTGSLEPQDLTGLPASATATATSSPSSTSDAKTASPLDAQAHGSGKNVGIAIGIAIAIILLGVISTILIFCARKRKQAKQAKHSGKQTNLEFIRPFVAPRSPGGIAQKMRFVRQFLLQGELFGKSILAPAYRNDDFEKGNQANILSQRSPSDSTLTNRRCTTTISSFQRSRL